MFVALSMLLLGVVGAAAFLSSSAATLGPTIAGLGCILGIFLRMCQAKMNHDELMNHLEKSKNAGRGAEK